MAKLWQMLTQIHQSSPCSDGLHGRNPPYTIRKGSSSDRLCFHSLQNKVWKKWRTFCSYWWGVQFRCVCYWCVLLSCVLWSEPCHLLLFVVSEKGGVHWEDSDAWLWYKSCHSWTHSGGIRCSTPSRLVLCSSFLVTLTDCFLHDQKLTHSQENVLDLQWLGSSGVHPEEMETAMRNMATHLQHILDQRDAHLEVQLWQHGNLSWQT